MRESCHTVSSIQQQCNGRHEDTARPCEYGTGTGDQRNRWAYTQQAPRRVLLCMYNAPTGSPNTPTYTSKYMYQVLVCITKNRQREDANISRPAEFRTLHYMYRDRVEFSATSMRWERLLLCCSPARVRSFKQLVLLYYIQ